MREQSREERPRAQVFRRELPGGGYVVLGVERATSDHTVARTCVWVERRDAELAVPDTRLIASADGDEQSDVFTEMYRLAADNAAIARGLMGCQAPRQESRERAD